MPVLGFSDYSLLSEAVKVKIDNLITRLYFSPLIIVALTSVKYVKYAFLMLKSQQQHLFLPRLLTSLLFTTIPILKACQISS